MPLYYSYWPIEHYTVCSCIWLHRRLLWSMY